MSDSSWMNNPLLKDIDPVKLQILTSLANEAGTKKSSELMPFFMSAMNQANEKGVNFTSPEKELLTDILLQQLSPQERKKAETIIKMASAFHKR